MSAYWLNEIIRTAVLFVTAYLLGLWVLRGGIRVNYTRKIQQLDHPRHRVASFDRPEDRRIPCSGWARRSLRPTSCWC